MGDLTFGEGFTTGVERCRAAPEGQMFVFDWNQAAALIKEYGPEYAEAGLLGDWICTRGAIVVEGQSHAAWSAYLASRWAKPALRMDGMEFECYFNRADLEEGDERLEWDHETRWPKSALRILGLEL